MLSDALKAKLIRLAEMQTMDESGDDNDGPSIDDAMIDAEIELARAVLHDLEIPFTEK